MSSADPIKLLPKSLNKCRPNSKVRNLSSFLTVIGRCIVLRLQDTDSIACLARMGRLFPKFQCLSVRMQQLFNFSVFCFFINELTEYLKMLVAQSFKLKSTRTKCFNKAFELFLGMSILSKISAYKVLQSSTTSKLDLRCRGIDNV